MISDIEDVCFFDVDYQHRTAFGFLQMAQCYAIGQWMG